jgi:hypothetical protein
METRLTVIAVLSTVLTSMFKVMEILGLCKSAQSTNVAPPVRRETVPVATILASARLGLLLGPNLSVRSSQMAAAAGFI